MAALPPIAASSLPLLVSLPAASPAASPAAAPAAAADIRPTTAAAISALSVHLSQTPLIKSSPTLRAKVINDLKGFFRRLALQGRSFDPIPSEDFRRIVDVLMFDPGEATQCDPDKPSAAEDEDEGVVYTLDDSMGFKLKMDFNTPTITIKHKIEGESRYTSGVVSPASAALYILKRYSEDRRYTRDRLVQAIRQVPELQRLTPGLVELIGSYLVCSNLVNIAPPPELELTSCGRVFNACEEAMRPAGDQGELGDWNLNRPEAFKHFVLQALVGQDLEVYREENEEREKAGLPIDIDERARELAKLFKQGGGPCPIIMHRCVYNPHVDIIPGERLIEINGVGYHVSVRFEIDASRGTTRMQGYLHNKECPEGTPMLAASLYSYIMNCGAVLQLFLTKRRKEAGKSVADPFGTYLADGLPPFMDRLAREVDFVLDLPLRSEKPSRKPEAISTASAPAAPAAPPEATDGEGGGSQKRRKIDPS